MRRLVWVAIGAAGGIVVYRRAQQAMADARERGLVQSAQQVGVSAASALAAARTLAAGASSGTDARTVPEPRERGSAAARALISATGQKGGSRGLR